MDNFSLLHFVQWKSEICVSFNEKVESFLVTFLSLEKWSHFCHLAFFEWKRGVTFPLFALVSVEKWRFFVFVFSLRLVP